MELPPPCSGLHRLASPAPAAAQPQMLSRTLKDAIAGSKQPRVTCRVSFQPLPSAQVADTSGNLKYATPVSDFHCPPSVLLEHRDIGTISVCGGTLCLSLPTIKREQKPPLRLFGGSSRQTACWLTACRYWKLEGGASTVGLACVPKGSGQRPTNA